MMPAYFSQPTLSWLIVNLKGCEIYLLCPTFHHKAEQSKAQGIQLILNEANLNGH